MLPVLYSFEFLPYSSMAQKCSVRCRPLYMLTLGWVDRERGLGETGTPKDTVDNVSFKLFLGTSLSSLLFQMLANLSTLR